MEKEKHFCRKRRPHSSRVDEVNLAAKCCPKHNTVAEMGNNDNDKTAYIYVNLLKIILSIILLIKFTSGVRHFILVEIKLVENKMHIWKLQSRKSLDKNRIAVYCCRLQLVFKPLNDFSPAPTVIIFYHWSWCGLEPNIADIFRGVFTEKQDMNEYKET